MKRALCLWILIIQGCAVVAPVSDEEECALEKMKLFGIDHGEGGAVSINQGSGVTTTRSYSRNRMCVKPENEAEVSQIEDLRQIVAPRLEYNSNITTKRMVTGIGYYLFILPGVGAKLYYDSQYDAAMEKSKKVAEEIQQRRQTNRSVSSEHP